jgi:hypothetical protein
MSRDLVAAETVEIETAFFHVGVVAGDTVGADKGVYRTGQWRGRLLGRGRVCDRNQQHGKE